MRELLPNRRRGETLDFEHGGFIFTATLGRYTDGRIGEIFLRSGKTGTDLSVACQETAIAVSFALQNGCTIDQMCEAMPRQTDGAPEGAMGTLFDLLAEVGA